MGTWLFVNRARWLAAVEAGVTGLSPLFGLQFGALLPLSVLTVLGAWLARSFWRRVPAGGLRLRAVLGALAVASPVGVGVLKEALAPPMRYAGDPGWTLGLPEAVISMGLTAPPVALAVAVVLRVAQATRDRRRAL